MSFPLNPVDGDKTIQNGIKYTYSEITNSWRRDFNNVLDQLFIGGTYESTSTTTGALIVVGGVGIGGNLYVGGQLLGPAIDDLITQSIGVYINTATTSSYFITLTDNIGTFSNVLSTSTFYFDGDAQKLNVDKIAVLNTSVNTTTISDQSLTVEGAAYVNQGIYSDVSGNPDENYLLYTPVTTISTTTPISARVGDFWINTSGPYFLQYVNDGGNKIWVQI
jgi:hypothetical protein